LSIFPVANKKKEKKKIKNPGAYAQDLVKKNIALNDTWIIKGTTVNNGGGKILFDQYRKQK
jgi:hypothetical protein